MSLDQKSIIYQTVIGVDFFLCVEGMKWPHAKCYSRHDRQQECGGPMGRHVKIMIDNRNTAVQWAAILRLC